MAPNKETTKVVVFSEVERTFLNQELTECNRRIAQLKSTVQQYETQNEELQKSYDQLDVDRANIVSNLKKVLATKSEEYNVLKQRVDSLEKIREQETAQFQESISKLEKNYKTIKDRLTSENKLLSGKINTLQEFRAVKDDLMDKFLKQEEMFEEQEMKFKRQLYNTEKKFVIGKDNLKKQMEARLLRLAQDFQDASELKIAASTHRVIRENIAMNNELDKLLSIQQKVSDQNKMYKEYIKAAAIAKELAEEERDVTINKNIIQVKVIDRLTATFETLKKEKGIFEKKKFDFEKLQSIMKKVTKENEHLILRVRILEQNMHAKLCDHNKTIADASKTSKERDKLRTILQDTDFAIKAALKFDQWVDSEQKGMDRKFLTNLLQIVSRFDEIQGSESLATLVSFSNVYNKGDLGFVPKIPVKKTSELSRCGSIMTKLTAGSLRLASRKSIATTSASNTSFSSSIKTIPSIQILPEVTNLGIPETTQSIESFVTSTQSTDLKDKESDVEDEAKTDLEKKLLASKLEIQKSILKDLAYADFSIKSSQQALLAKQSTSVVFSNTNLTLPLEKSVTISSSNGNIKESNSSTHVLSRSESKDLVKENFQSEGEQSLITEEAVESTRITSTDDNDNK